MLKKRIWLSGALLLMFVSGVAYAVANNSFEISWWSVDGGGGSSTGGNYNLSGTSGQPDAGYQSGGDYSLAGGSWISAEISDYIQANFYGTPTAGPVHLTVKFTNTSQGPYTGCLWEFGDTSISNSCGNPTHVYTKPGTYTVKLTVSRPGGSNTRTLTSYITAENAIAYLPMVMKNFCGGFAGPREVEPDNNSETTANGPLCLFTTYIGSPDDDWPGLESDYYYFDWKGGQFTVHVTKFLKSNAQVQLYLENTGNLLIDPPVADQLSGNYIFSYNGPAGKYLIRVVAIAGHAAGNGDYNLRVTTP